MQTKLNLQSRINQYCILQVHTIYLKIVCKHCFHAYNQHNYRKKCVLSFAKSLKSTKAKNLVKQMLLKKFSEKYNLEMEKEKELKKLSSFNIYWLWTEFKFLNIVFKCCNYSTIYFGFIFSVNLIEAEKRWKTL